MSGPLSWGRKDWVRFERHAALGAIDAHRNDLARFIKQADRALDRLNVLREMRLDQIARGDWPPTQTDGGTQ